MSHCNHGFWQERPLKVRNALGLPTIGVCFFLLGRSTHEIPINSRDAVMLNQFSRSRVRVILVFYVCKTLIRSIFLPAIPSNVIQTVLWFSELKCIRHMVKHVLIITRGFWSNIEINDWHRNQLQQDKKQQSINLRSRSNHLFCIKFFWVQTSRKECPWWTLEPICGFSIFFLILLRRVVVLSGKIRKAIFDYFRINSNAIFLEEEKGHNERQRFPRFWAPASRKSVG